MRTQTHIIDSRAVKAVMAVLPDHWVVRELTERDYGIDLMVEIFAPGLTDAQGKEAFMATGAVFHIQIKGTEAKLVPASDGTIHYSIEKKSLIYLEKFSTPFFLFRVSVTAPQSIYFLWIQRYIRSDLDRDEPMWREASSKKITVRIPLKNALSQSMQRIEEISFEPKFMEELVEFSEIYSDIGNRIDGILAGVIDADESEINDLKSRAYRAKRLEVLLARNNCCVTRKCVDDLIEYIGELDTAKVRGDAPPGWMNFKMLALSVTSYEPVREFVFENEDTPIY